MTTLENMARAVAVAQVEKIGGPIKDPNDPHDIDCAVILVRAALEAMRNPSDGMLDAYSTAVMSVSPHQSPDAYHCDQVGFSAMIDHVLAEHDQSNLK